MAEFDLEKEMRTIVNKFSEKNFKATQESLKEVGAEMANVLTASTPATKGSGLFRASWKIKSYKNAVYVYNSRGVKGLNAGIPVSNLAEYSARGPKPFIINTFNANKTKIYNDFVKKMKQKII